MKRKILSLLAVFSLFTAIAFAAPDFDNPASETGILYRFDDNKFYINGYELQDLNTHQIQELTAVAGKTVTIKGYYEKEYNPFRGPNEIYVTEISKK